MRSQSPEVLAVLAIVLATTLVVFWRAALLVLVVITTAGFVLGILEMASVLGSLQI